MDEQARHISTKLEIKSLILVEVLHEVITNYPGNDFNALYADTVTLIEPYMILFHHFYQLEEKCRSLEGEKQEHLKFLLETLDKELPMVSKTARELTDHATHQKKLSAISFRSLWLLYSPETLVYQRSRYGIPAHIVESLGGFSRLSDGSWEALRLTLKNYTFSNTGKYLVPDSMDASIDEFAVEMAIEDLPCIPTRYLPNEESQRDYLVERGKKYTSYKDEPIFMEYRDDA